MLNQKTMILKLRYKAFSYLKKTKKNSEENIISYLFMILVYFV